MLILYKLVMYGELKSHSSSLDARGGLRSSARSSGLVDAIMCTGRSATCSTGAGITNAISLTDFSTSSLSCIPGMIATALTMKSVSLGTSKGLSYSFPVSADGSDISRVYRIIASVLEQIMLTLWKSFRGSTFITGFGTRSRLSS